MIRLGSLEHEFQGNSRDQGPGKCHWCSLGPEFHPGGEKKVDRTQSCETPCPCPLECTETCHEVHYPFEFDHEEGSCQTSTRTPSTPTPLP